MNICTLSEVGLDVTADSVFADPVIGDVDFPAFVIWDFMKKKPPTPPKRISASKVKMTMSRLFCIKRIIPQAR